MGNYTEFCATNRAAAPSAGELGDDAPYLSAKYLLPAVWLALFGVDDLQVFHDVDEPDQLVTHLSAPREAALQRLAARRAWLLDHVNGLRPAWLAQFEAWLAALPQSHVHLSTDSVAGMSYSIEEWSRELPLVLRMIGEAAPPAPAAPKPAGALATLMRRLRGEPAPQPVESPAWDRYNRVFGDMAFDDPPKSWVFLGSGDRPMPWEDDD